MRLRFGVCMPEKGGRTAIVGVERVTPFSVEAATARVTSLVNSLEDEKPCVLVDAGTPQGLALRQAMRAAWSRKLHRPHAYLGTGMRAPLFSAFLQAYSEGRVRFEPFLAGRAELDKALVFYMGGGVKKEGIALSSEDEALVIALGLAIFWPKHGGLARKI